MVLNDIQRDIQNSLTNGFVDQNFFGNENMLPEFIHNESGDTMLLHIEQELDHCSAFFFAIAFITEGALTSLKVKLADLATKGIHGSILTSDYLAFNSPKAFNELQKLTNVEVRIADMQNFHAKGYIFDHARDKYQTIIIGSSNLTESALSINYEWNIKLTSYQNGNITEKLIAEARSSWQRAIPLTDDWIRGYQTRYEKKDHLSDFKVAQTVPAYETEPGIEPNGMQKEALTKLKSVRSHGAEKALIISATGTGKTYLGALDVRYYQPNKFLYIVHREQILDRTIESFRKVIGGDPEQFGKMSGSQKNINAKYLFATIQTLSQSNWLNQFNSDEFDYILVDEAHRAGSQTYQKVLNYFQPNFLLGMTATPERMDQFNLYELFDYNIAYEIRLQQALDEKMLCPFHYLGIADYEQNGQLVKDVDQLQWLVSEERVDYILKETAYYGYSGDVLQGLIFCSRKDEAELLSKLLTAKGHASKAITGDMPQKQRDIIVTELEDQKIEYIITVDVFNEGIDIPCVNQIVMLRNTQSSIVFIQQLGRGLRKSSNKKFVTVIDFIGNYQNNYLIPIALTGDRTRSKDNARDDLELRQISGVSTINFSEVAKERIYQSINNTSLDSLKVLRDDFQSLKDRLGRRPLLFDFQKFGLIDGTVIVDKYQNYYQFLLKMKEDVHLTISEDRVLTFVSLELLNGKRPVELLLLQKLVSTGAPVSNQKFASYLAKRNIFYNNVVEQSVINVLSLNFYTKANQQKYGNQPIVFNNNETFELNSVLADQLKTDSIFQQLFLDVLQAGLLMAEKYDKSQQFTLYQRYTRKDVCRLLGWQSDVSSTVYGYRVRNRDCPIFVTYSKAEDVEDSVNYQDRFINAGTFQWYTRHNVKLTSNEMKKILEKETNIKLFIKKNDDEGKGFYYFGEVSVESTAQEEFFVDDHKIEPIVRVYLKLKHPARYDKYLLLEK